MKTAAVLLGFAFLALLTYGLILNTLAWALGIEVTWPVVVLVVGMGFFGNVIDDFSKRTADAYRNRLP